MRGSPRILWYLLLSLYILWPLPLHLGDHLARAEEADPYLVVHTMERFARNLLSNSGGLWEDESFAPEKNVLAFADPLVGLSILSEPIRRATGNPVFAYNVFLLLASILSGLAAHALAERYAGERGAYFAGTAFLLSPMRTAHMRHLQIYWTAFLPLLFLFAMRLREAPDTARARRDALALGGLLLLQGLFGFYFFAFALPLLALLLFLPGDAVRSRAWGAAALLAPVLLLSALYLPIRKIHDAHGFARDARESVYYSARLDSYLAPAPETLAGRLSPLRWDREGERFPGAAFFIAACACAAARPAPPRHERKAFVVLAALGAGGLLLSLPSLGLSGVAWSNPAALASISLAFACGAGLLILHQRPGPLGLAAVGAFLLSLGPLVMAGPVARAAWSAGPYAILQVLPGYSSLRVPSRFAFFVLVALLPAAAKGFNRLPRPAQAVLFILLLMETATGPVGLTPVEIPGKLAPETAAAALLPADWILAEAGAAPRVGAGTRAWEAPRAPAPDEAAQARAVYRAGLHRHRIVNGFASHWTARNDAARKATRDYPAPEALAALRRLGVRVVIVPGGGLQGCDPEAEKAVRSATAR